MEMEWELKQRLITMAVEARKHAYAPYSEYMVGAAVLCEDGSIYTGCNVENASYGASNCAERTAVFKAVSQGKRRFAAIAIVGGKNSAVAACEAYAPPCGICRQVLREFCNPAGMLVLIAKSTEDFLETTLEALLPESFGPDILNVEGER